MGFIQAGGSNAVMSGTVLRDQALHIIITLGIVDLKASNGWIDSFMSAVGKCRKGQLRKIAMVKNQRI
jgi:hypothetical protein